MAKQIPAWLSQVPVINSPALTAAIQAAEKAEGNPAILADKHATGLALAAVADALEAGV